MRYIKEGINEDGRPFILTAETTTAHAVLERFGFVSETERDRQKRISESLAKMKAALCPVHSQAFGLCGCQKVER